MLDGITILNSYEIVTKTSFSWQGFWVGLAICVIGAFLGALITTSDLKDFLITFGIISVICGVLVGLFFGFAVMPKPLEYASEYEVTISNEVSMNDFYNRYDIIEQRGEIYVIREKEQED